MSRRPRRQLPYARRQPGRPFWQRISATGWLLLGIIGGLGIGLYYAWVIDPIIYVDASPARLSERYQAEYIFLVSQSFAADGHWPRAQQRLAALEDPNLTQTVNDLLETYIRDLQSPDALRHMAALAQQLGAQGGAVAIFAPTPDVLPTPTLAAQVVASPLPPPTLVPTDVPLPTPTASPTVSPTPTVEQAYRLLNQERACGAEDALPHIEVVTQDEFLEELPGVEVMVRWATGEDRFFTGFKPDVGVGYGDFTMVPDVSYTVVLVEGSPEVSGLRIGPCDDGREGGWRLVFQRLGADRAPGRDE